MSACTRIPRWGTASIASIVCLFVAAAAAGEAAAGGLVAPRSQCKGQKNVKAPERQQESAMRCLINYARAHVGASGLGANRSLERAAGRKAGDVMRCGFSHTACGKPADAYARRYGYTSASGWQWGENLAWGRGKRGTARSILKAWLHSPPHRETMFRGSFHHAGIGLKRGGFGGRRNSAVWVLEVGCHGCS